MVDFNCAVCGKPEVVLTVKSVPYCLDHAPPLGSPERPLSETLTLKIRAADVPAPAGHYDCECYPDGPVADRARAGFPAFVAETIAASDLRYPGAKHATVAAHIEHTAKRPLPDDSAARKAVPLYSGCLAYFPDALAAVAELSRVGNDKHNPGQPLHWSRGKSDDHADCIARHLLEAGTIDTDGIAHSAKVAWRALAMLQIEIEAARDTK